MHKAAGVAVKSQRRRTYFRFARFLEDTFLAGFFLAGAFFADAFAF